MKRETEKKGEQETGSNLGKVSGNGPKRKPGLEKGDVKQKFINMRKTGKMSIGNLFINFYSLVARPVSIDSL